jgi:hypothetical protein
MQSEKSLNTFLLDALVDGEIKDVPAIKGENSHALYEILVEKHLLSNSTLSGKSEVEPWLRSRLLESLIAHVGVLKYIDDLLEYEGKKPERDVKMNSYLAATHISFSLNRVIYDTLMRLGQFRRLSLTSHQISDLARVLNPPRPLIVPTLTQSFDPILVEDVRSSIQRIIWDELAMEEESFKKPRSANSSDAIPKDLVFLGTVPELTTKDLLDLSMKFSFFKIIIRDGYFIWNFEGAPTTYIAKNKLFYSPSQSKAFSKQDIQEQYRNVVRLLRRTIEKRALCAICSTKSAKEVALTLDGRLIQVCEDCVSAPSVWRVIHSTDLKRVR